jgi:hypothetical protein
MGLRRIGQLKSFRHERSFLCEMGQVRRYGRVNEHVVHSIGTGA